MILTIVNTIKPLKNAPLETDKSILNMLILQTNIFGMELKTVFWVKRKLFKFRTNSLKIGENVLIFSLVPRRFAHKKMSLTI